MTNRFSLDRRSLIKGMGGILSTGLFPAIHAREPVTLRAIGTAMNIDKNIVEKFRADTGINMQLVSMTTDDISRRAITAPNSFDIIDTEYFSLRKILPAGNLKGIDVNKIKLADKISPVFTRGEIAGKKIGDQGTAPKKVIYLEKEDSKSFAKQATQFMTLIPSTYMGDTLGIRPDLVTAKVTSWSALLNPAHKGRASIMNIPSIGIMDAAMAIEAMSLYKYPDKGNMTRPEIDMTIKTLIEAKRAGQFRSLWRDFNESINLMASGETVVQSMWANAVTEVKARGIACTYQPLQEGYRAWGSGLGISKAVRGAKLDAAYEFLNWYLSGWVGGYLVRQGFYSAVLETTKAGMPAYDWDYWMEGKPAGQQILNVRGTAIAKKGEVRDGGSYEARMSAVACWNSVMDENTYMVQKWNEFVSA